MSTSWFLSLVRPCVLRLPPEKIALPTAFVLAMLLSLAVPGRAQTSFPATTVGTTTPATSAVTVNIQSGPVTQVEVLTMGAQHLDYTESGLGDNCVGQSSGSCTVNVAFVPKYPGVRNGAVVLLDTNNQTVGTTYLTGIGNGSLGVMIPGAISTIAGEEGQWSQVNDGQPATQADLYLPTGVAVDGAGNVFIADSHHNLIREVLAAATVFQGISYTAGAMITVAGDGSAGPPQNAVNATTVSLNLPGGVAIDGAGNLYIADTNNNVIREVNLTTDAITTVAGNVGGNPGYSGDGGNAIGAELNGPEGITVDPAGNLYIADTGNNRIRKVSGVILSGGTITTFAGTGTAGFSGDSSPATSAKLNAPYGVALDASGNLYIADSANNRVRRVDGSGTITTYAGTGTAGYSVDPGPATSAELDSPMGVAVDPAGNLYIADARNYVVRKVSSATGNTISTVAGNFYTSVYGDGKSGYAYGNGQWGEYYAGPGIANGAGIYAPYAVALDQAGNLYIAEYFDHLVREVAANDATIFVSPELWQNQVSTAQPQAIENDGNTDLSFTAIVPDSNAAVDAGSTNCSASTPLGIDEQCNIGAELAPTAAGPSPLNQLVGNINITSDPTINPTANPPDSLSIQLVGQVLGLNGAVVSLTSNPNPSSYGQTVTLNVNVAQGTGSSQGTPTGTVTFSDRFQGVTTPLGTVLTLDPGGNASLQIGTLAVGTHVITASYSGDTYYSAATSNSVTQVVQEQITVTLASSSPNDTSMLGTMVTFTAGVSISGGIVPTGAVTFYNGTTTLGTGSLNASGVATFATANLPVGSNSITAAYTDVNRVSATSAPLIQTVEQQTVTTVNSSLNPSIHGTPVLFTATVTAAGTVVPTGTVAFLDGGVQIGTAALVGSGPLSAVAMFQTSSLTAGTHAITAAYSGDANDLSSTSGPLTQTVNVASTTTALSAGANPAIAGKTLTLTATVSADSGVAAGTVNFYSGGRLLGSGTLNNAGIATYSTAALAVGSYSLTATYQGDPNDTGSTSSPLPLTVIQATTNVRLASSNLSIVVTSPVTFTATVSGNGGVPTGNIAFMDGATMLGSVAVNGSGVATYTTSALAVGQHVIAAVYSGDANDAGSTSPAITQVVTAYGTQTTLATSATNLNTDQQLTLLSTTTSTSGNPVTGAITYMNGTTTLGTATVGASGAATLTITNPAAGSYNITAHYSGDSLNAPSVSNAVAVTITQATEFTIQLNPTAVTIPTTHSTVIAINLASQNGFADKVALGCDSLPYSVTCNFSSNDVALNANGTTTVQLTVDTNSPLAAGAQAKNEMPGSHGMLAACLFPGTALFGLAFWRFRRRSSVLKVLTVVAMLTGATFLMTGCGGYSLNSAKAGSYVIQISATGEQTGVTHVANLTVQVTQ